MADAPRSGAKKQKIQFAMDEAELRSLRIPSSVHRGALSPSKNGFLPTLMEHQQERMQAQNKRERQRRTEKDGEERRRPWAQMRSHADGVVSEISAELLDSIKEDFSAYGGVLNIEQFTRCILRNVAAQADEDKMEKRVNFSPEGEQISRTPDTASIEVSRAAERAAAAIELFERIDVHNEGCITWEDVSNSFIEQGMAAGDEFTVDTIKAYEQSPVVDMSKHEAYVEKLVYMEQIDYMACLSRESRQFRLYNPKRCIVTHTISGHRGTVIDACYVDAYNQIATTGADMSICLWESPTGGSGGHSAPSDTLGLRNRMSAKDVQLCMQWDPQSQSLFSGAIDGTLIRWDLQQMCAADMRRGQHKKAINDLLMVKDINLLASASSDGTVLMWDTATMKQRKTFRGAKKGTFSLAYSNDYHCLLTSGLDQEALVWNPYVERVPIFRLKGHTHALCGVAVVPGTPQILTADVKGNFRLWDVRNFRCVQSFGGSDNQNEHVNSNSKFELNTFCAIPQHKRVAAGGNKITLYDYMDEWGGENVTDSGGVTEGLYNPLAGSFYTISKQCVKQWSAGTGDLFKVLRDIAKHEITAACLADNGRKLYLGDSKGRVVAHGLYNGTQLTEFERHKGDISCLAIWPGTNRLFSASWDGMLKVHSDECTRPPQMKAKFSDHRDGVTCMKCCPELQLLATGGTDMQVCLYDIKSLKLEHQLNRFHHVIAGIDFMPRRCLLAIADQGGLVSFWRTRPHPDKWQCIYHFKNHLFLGRQMPAPGAQGGKPPAPIPVTCLRFAASDDPQEKVPPWLYTGDAKGMIRCWDMSSLFERKRIHEIDLYDRQRNPGQLVVRPGRGSEQPSARDAVHDVPHDPLPIASSAPASASGYPSVGASSGVTSGGAFLTGVDICADHDERTSAIAIGGATTVRAAVPAPVDSALVQSVAGPPLHDHPELDLIHEAEGHSEQIVSMHVTQKPVALMTCGQDCRVRCWTLQLEPYGVLLQNRDRSFKFPYDPSVKRQRDIETARELLRRLGPVQAKSRLPMMPLSARSAQDTLMELGTHGRRRPQKKKDPDAVWKVTAERVISDPDADEDDYRILFEQMERVGQGNNAVEAAVDDTAVDRLVKNAYARHAARMPHRCVALSRDEASAADRLARAMQALGGDEHGTYRSMAKALDPKARGIDAMTPRTR